MAKLNQKTFNSDGSWVCPAGVTNILVYGCSGGRGGDGGANATFAVALGGSSQVPYLRQVTVVPNTTYTITIGTGGTAGTAGTGGGFGGSGGFGASTTFGSLATFSIGNIGAISGSLGQVMAIISPYVAEANTNATDASFYYGGAKGAPSTVAGVAGGAANAAGAGSAGTSAAANTGGGGGGGGAGSTAGGAGGAGGSGFLIVAWVE